MAKVYVSSTFVDLKDCRQRVSIVLKQMGYEDVAMEYYTAGNQRPVDKCLEDVAACDLYVGIFAWRYGWIPPDNNPDQLSITDMEYHQAARNGKECLIFLLHEEAPWPRKFMDRDPLRIEQLRTYLSNRHLCAFFKSADDIGSTLGPAVHLWAKAHSHTAVGVTIAEFDLDAYYTALKKRYRRIDLEGLTPPQREEYLQLQLRSIFVEQSVRENPPPLELSKEVWEKLRLEKEILPEDLPDGMTVDDMHRARKLYYEKPARPVLETLIDANYQYLVVLGDPGSGKSTLSRYVLLSLIDPTGDERLRSAFNGYLPLLIELRSYAGLCADNKCKNFLEFLEYLGETEGWHFTKEALHQYLNNEGRAVVIFDGLDEIFDPENRERISRQIVGFASNYAKSRIIVTSRIVGYRRNILTDGEFSHFTLQDLDKSQVATFVQQWYDLAMSDQLKEAKERRIRILRSFNESASIRQLAGNPMLLTIMAIIGKHQELPRERWRLYDHAASVLIEHWDVNKHLRDQRVQAELIGQNEKKEMLRRLAYKMQSGAGGLAGNYIHREELQEEFEDYLKERYNLSLDRATIIARVIIDQFRERNFILSLHGANLFGFVHRAFLEYFCATAFINKFEKTQEMPLEQLKQSAYGAHWEDQTWHEVLRLICGIIDERFVGEIIDYLINEIHKPRPKSYDSQPPWDIALAVQCLSEVKNLSMVAEPAKGLLKTTSLLFEYAVLRIGSGELDKFIKTQVAAYVEIIGAHWPHRTMMIEVADWLKKVKSVNSSWDCAESFGIFVGSVGAGLDDIYKTLLDCAFHSDPEIRFLATFALAKGWRKEQLTLPVLQEMLVNDNYQWVRRAASYVLSQYFSKDPYTLELLRIAKQKEQL